MASLCSKRRGILDVSERWKDVELSMNELRGVETTGEAELR